MAHKVTLLKEQGNAHYVAGEYGDAYECFTQAIMKDPSNPRLFTNRAMTALRLHDAESCERDCRNALVLDPNNMKAHFYLAHAQLALRHPHEAFAAATAAYDRCNKTGDYKSMQSAGHLVLQAKKLRWEQSERARARTKTALLGELEDALRRNAQAELAEVEERSLDGSAAHEEREDIRRALELKIEELYTVWSLQSHTEISSSNNETDTASTTPPLTVRPPPPDHLIDSITFSVMHDPYMTKSGTSYDKSTLLEHLQHHADDPLTREPLTINEIKPNRNLKEACDAYIAENGWVVDW